ncbi:MAG: hypothetical protein A4E70_01208 [Syntrophus sp. PtaU1.Bin005]|nr:MAG: hypothetical protein A4E70_01208 [Syntrophus sp. PtaU1.Bin005]
MILIAFNRWRYHLDGHIGGMGEGLTVQKIPSFNMRIRNR